MEAHQGQQSVTADFEASAMAESEAGSVWEECLECAGGCQSDKELCGEAPNPFYIAGSQAGGKSSTQARGFGGAEER